MEKFKQMMADFWGKLRSYIDPTSLTWWSSMAMLISGVLKASDVEIGFGVSMILRPILSAIEPGGAHAMILLGLTGIGLNGKFYRARH